MRCRGEKNLIPGIIFVFFIFHFCGLMALDPAQSIDQYVLDQWKNKDGLASNTIHSIAQTPDGYMWFATSKGLARFDGVKFSTIEYRKKQEIKNRKRYPQDTLFVDKQGILWIGGMQGLTKYHYETGQFTIFTGKDGVKRQQIYYLN
ncbi:MAG: hypothetical protein JSV88_23975, partial [Candidatus Aminicenantes bacterium]